MSAKQGTIRFRLDGERLVFQVEGQATLQQSLSFRRLAECALTSAQGCTLIDLQYCTYVDSTFVGTLLYLLKAARKQGPDRLALLSPSQPCRDALQQMGVIDLFSYQESSGEGGTSTWNELGKSGDDPDAFRRAIFDAHEELANIPGPAAEAFRAVVRCMKKEMGQDAPPSQDP